MPRLRLVLALQAVVALGAPAVVLVHPVRALPKRERAFRTEIPHAVRARIAVEARRAAGKRMKLDLRAAVADGPSAVVLVHPLRELPAQIRAVARADGPGAAGEALILADRWLVVAGGAGVAGPLAGQRVDGSLGAWTRRGVRHGKGGQQGGGGDKMEGHGENLVRGRDADVDSTGVDGCTPFYTAL